MRTGDLGDEAGPGSRVVTVDLDDPVLQSSRGRGVRVAIIDSGVAEDHPHIRSVAASLAVRSDGSLAPATKDRLGHGTAVAAAIQEKAPEAELIVIQVFFFQLSTPVSALARAIDLASEQGADLINLSLGTPELDRREILQPSVERALERGSWIVSPSRHGQRIWLPGALDGVVGVQSGKDLPRQQLLWRLRSEGPECAASPHPRPIPGVPSQLNLSGVSFSAANVTGILARALEGRPGIGVEELDFLFRSR